MGERSSLFVFSPPSLHDLAWKQWILSSYLPPVEKTNSLWIVTTPHPHHTATGQRLHGTFTWERETLKLNIFPLFILSGNGMTTHCNLSIPTHNNTTNTIMIIGGLPLSLNYSDWSPLQLSQWWQLETWRAWPKEKKKFLFTRSPSILEIFTPDLNSRLLSHGSFILCSHEDVLCS